MSEKPVDPDAVQQQAVYSFDDVLCAIGEFGKWQKILWFLVPLIGIIHAMNALGQVFMAGEADHWCRVAAWNETKCTAGGQPDDWACLVEKRNASVPLIKNSDGDVVFDSCNMYDVRDVHFKPGMNASDYTNKTIECFEADGWVYDTRQYEKTIINEFNLVCDQQPSVSLLQSVFFAGFLVGSLVFGSLADWIGRKPAIFLASTLTLGASVANAFSPNAIAYMCLRFLVGAGAMGAFLISFVLVTEYIGPSKRAPVGISIQGFFTTGVVILPLIAYFVRDWRGLQLCIGAPTVLYFFLFFFIPESARWQISKGKYKQAEKTLRKIAAWNNQEFPEEMFNPGALGASKEDANKQYTAVALFRTPNMCFKTLIIMFYWFVVNIVYYGLGLSTSDLGVDDYLAAVISGLVEYPSLIYCIIALRYSGWRINLSGTMVLGGVACIVTAFLDAGVVRTVIAMIGKFGIAGAFAIIYVVSGEIFPTPVRSAGMGLSSMSSRISGIISPFVLELNSVWGPFPYVIFGALSVAAGLLSLLLPETRNKKLPETLEEGEAFGKPRCFTGNGPEYDDDTTVTVAVTALNTKQGMDNIAFEDKGTQTNKSAFKPVVKSSIISQESHYNQNFF